LKKAGKTEGDKEPVYNYDDPDLIQNRPALQRAFVISAGVIFNMILSWSAIFVSVSTVGVTTPIVMPGVAVPGIADPNGAAARYGLAEGDVIMQVNGKDLLGGDDSTRTVVQVCVCVCVFITAVPITKLFAVMTPRARWYRLSMTQKQGRWT